MSDIAAQNDTLNLLELPEDILQDMLLLLDGNELGTCRLVSKVCEESCRTNLTPGR